LFNIPPQTDSLLTWMQQTVDRSPSWLLPYLDAAEEINVSTNDVPRAEAWLLKAKKWNPTSYLLLLRLSWLKQWQGKPEEANAICRELIEQRPNIADAWSTMGTTQIFLQNDYLEAEKSSRRALELEPNHVNAFQPLGRSLANINPKKGVEFCEKHLREDSLSAFAKGILINALVVALIQLRRFDAAEKWIDLMEKEGYGFMFLHFSNLNEKGRMRLMQYRLADAEIELQKALNVDNTTNPLNIQAFALLGKVKYRQGKLVEAESFFKKSIEYIEPGGENAFKHDAFFLYGRFLLYQNRPDEAQIQFDKALKISPKTWHHPLGMTLLAAKNGHETEALDWLEKALDRYYFDETTIMEEPLFDGIRKSKRYKEMMLKYFP
jgi:pentatricopeptide repeat protein